MPAKASILHAFQNKQTVQTNVKNIADSLMKKIIIIIGGPANSGMSNTITSLGGRDF